jgi:protein KRI1
MIRKMAVTKKLSHKTQPSQNHEVDQQHEEELMKAVTSSDDNFREKEEKETTSSSEEEEDEMGELITPELDAQILRTISLIRSKDPVIYDTLQTFFNEKDMEKMRQEWRERQVQIREQTKKMTLKDYEREQILLQMEKPSSISPPQPQEKKTSLPPPQLLTASEMQEYLRRELADAFHNNSLSNNNKNDDDEENIEAGLFRQRIPSREQLVQQEKDYRTFLLAEEEKEREKRADELATLRRYWNDPHLDENERFLRE